MYLHAKDTWANTLHFPQSLLLLKVITGISIVLTAKYISNNFLLRYILQTSLSVERDKVYPKKRAVCTRFLSSEQTRKSQF